VPLNEQKPFSTAHFVHDVVDVGEVLVEEVLVVVLVLDVPALYQQLLSAPGAGSVCETTPLEQLTPFVNGPLSVYFSGLEVPKTTFALPLKEQRLPSLAQ